MISVSIFDMNICTLIRLVWYHTFLYARRGVLHQYPIFNSVTHYQNSGFALVLAHSYTIIRPTTTKKEDFHALLSLLSTKEQTLCYKLG